MFRISKDIFMKRDWPKSMLYDVIIVGSGPAGLTAAIYALRSNKTVLVLEKETLGGQITSSPMVENFPGYQHISGNELVQNIMDQVINLGGIIELEEVIHIVDGKVKKIITDLNSYEAKAIIFAAGAKHRRIGLPKEEDFVGNGISFCVTCDGPFYKDKVVGVIGGGNTAIITALTLCDICQKVIIVQNLPKLTAEPNLLDKLANRKNVEIITNSTVCEILGEDELKGLKINVASKGIKQLDLDGMFVSIGLVPNTELVKGLLKLNDFNYVDANECRSTIPGIFVAGDVRSKRVRQLTTAVSDGTIAAIEAINYIDNEY